jgi:Rrf2 family transcriptional regulator, iron-sulfur cluster assembly transcription factor
MILYSAACEYALRALSRLAGKPEGEFMTVRALAEAEDLPTAFLATILGSLAEGGVLRSARGRFGGYALAVPAEAITLYEIRRVLDGVSDLGACAVGLAECTDDAPCPLHDSWTPVRDGIEAYLRRTSLRDMAEALARKRVAAGVSEPV